MLMVTMVEDVEQESGDARGGSPLASAQRGTEISLLAPTVDGAPLMERDPGLRPAGLVAIERLLQERMPDLRARYELAEDDRACAHDVERARVRVLAALPTFDGKTTLPEWVLEQARLAVEEGIGEALRLPARSAVRAYCQKRLAEAVEQYHHVYYLALGSAICHRHIQEAEHILDEQVALWEDGLPFERFIRRNPHRDDVERRGMDNLDAWLAAHARLAVERYVVEEMRSNPTSHVAMVNLGWVTQRVCRLCGFLPGEMIDPRQGYEALWSRLLASVPVHLREDIMDYSATISARILQGLPSFRFESNFDTWRTTIIRNTMASIKKKEQAHKTDERLFIRPSGDEGDETEQERVIADDRQSLDTQAELLDAYESMAKVLLTTFEDSHAIWTIIRMRLEGYSAKEIEKKCGMDADKVHHLLNRFRSELKRRRQEDDVE
jgi:DNA-directed RNA polymerase specialized sigma24 family protein